MDKSYKRIKAVETTLKIMEHLAECREPVTGSQVAEGTGFPFPTVMCHLATQQDQGYVQAVGDKFRIGMKLAVFWAREKSKKESEAQAIQADLRLLNGE